MSKTKGAVEVNLDDKGRMVLTDKTKSVTNIELTMYDAKMEIYLTEIAPA